MPHSLCTDNMDGAIKLEDSSIVNTLSTRGLQFLHLTWVGSFCVGSGGGGGGMWG